MGCWPVSWGRVMGTEAMTHLSRIQLTSGMKSVHGGLAACSERTRQGTLSDGVCTRRTGGVQSVHDRDPFGMESVHGQNTPHRAQFPSRETPYHVRFSPFSVHGGNPMGTRSAHGGGILCRVYSSSENVPHRARSLASPGKTARVVYAFRPERVSTAAGSLVPESGRGGPCGAPC